MSRTKAYFFISLFFGLTLALTAIFAVLHAWDPLPYQDDGNLFLSVLRGSLSVVLTVVGIGAFVSAVGVFLLFVYGPVLALKQRDTFLYVGFVLNAIFVVSIVYSVITDPYLFLH